MNTFIANVRHEFQRHKGLAEGAMSQIDDEAFFRRPGEVVNSVALIVKHLGGNLASRFTDFLTTDGEKPNRNRDGEFVMDATGHTGEVDAAMGSWLGGGAGHD